jgi:formate dehydrogenase
MAKVICVLYPDPVTGYPTSYARDEIPTLSRYPDGQTLPTPESVDFQPGALLGSVSGELGLRAFLERAGHTLVVTSDKDGPGCAFENERLADVSLRQWLAFTPYELVRAHLNIDKSVLAKIPTRKTPVVPA